MIMEDEKGLDEKVLAVPVNDPRFDEYRTLRDVPEHLLREIAHFFSTYKALEKKKWAKVGGWKVTLALPRVVFACRVLATTSLLNVALSREQRTRSCSLRRHTSPIVSGSRKRPRPEKPYEAQR